MFPPMSQNKILEQEMQLKILSFLKRGEDVDFHELFSGTNENVCFFVQNLIETIGDFGITKDKLMKLRLYTKEIFRNVCILAVSEL